MKPLPKIMWWLGYGGLVPFFSLVLALLLKPDMAFLHTIPLEWWLAVYTAVVLSFIGAMHWAFTLGMQNRLKESELGKLLLFSVVPTVVAWFALLLPISIALFVLAALIAFAYFADSILLFGKLPQGYGKMRLHLSIIVVLLLCAAGIVVS